MTHVSKEQIAETVATQNVSWVDEKRSRVCGKVLCLTVSTLGEG